MEFKLKNTLGIENIQINIDNEERFFRKFIIYDNSNLFQSQYFRKEETDDFIGKIKKSHINTGIMVSNLKINNLVIYLFILDNRIFILNQNNLPKYQEYFNEHLDSHIFMTAECKEDFFNAISLKKSNF